VHESGLDQISPAASTIGADRSPATQTPQVPEPAANQARCASSSSKPRDSPRPPALERARIDPV